MPASIVIPPHYWATQTEIEIRLVDTDGNPYPAATLDNSSLLAGHYLFVVDPALGYTLNLPCNDEIPAPPNVGGSSAWLICVRDARMPACYRAAIHSASPPSTWNELLGSAEQIDASHIFATRLLPLGATVGQLVSKDVGDAWIAIDPPSGTGDMIGPPSATDGHLVVFSGPSGKLTRSGGPVPTGGVDDHGQLTGLGDDDHLHYHTDARGDARYEALDATLLRQADVTSSPADGADTVPISAGWAYLHASALQVHGISAYGATLVSAIDAPAARNVLGAQEEITEIVAIAGF